MFKDTIFALSSARGKSALSVYRLSGPDSINIIQNLTNSNILFEHKKIQKVKLFDQITKNTKEIIDEVLIAYFKAPHSFTGEDVIEIYAHGSPAVAKSLTENVLNNKNVRYAAAGEFTKRAVLNSKMDLVSAEGLIDLINSETSIQKKQAINQMTSKPFDKIEKLRDDLLEILSLVEAYIDFPDEEIPESTIENAQEKIQRIQEVLEKVLQDKNKGERIREGIKLVIYGKPNVGKSSLINYLTKRNVAIVSDISGTTRDSLESHIDINGYPITIIDTAGIRENSQDKIEQEGIKLARNHIQAADIKIFLQDVLHQKIEFEEDKFTINVINKVDIINNTEDNIDHDLKSEDFIAVSITENIGLNKLIKKIEELASICAGNGEDVVITRTRQRSSIENAKKAIDDVNLRADLVLAAEDLRIATRELSILFGKVDVEEILDRVFSQFCIGK